MRDVRNVRYDDVAWFFEQVMKEDSQRAARCQFMRELTGEEDVARAL